MKTKQKVLKVEKDPLMDEVSCKGCDAPNEVDFHSANVEVIDDKPNVFYLTCKWTHCNYRGEYRYSDLKHLYLNKN